METSAPLFVGAFLHLEGSAVPVNLTHQEQIVAGETTQSIEKFHPVQEQVKIHTKNPEVQIPERIQQQTVLQRIEEQVGVVPALPIVDDTVEIQVTERIHEQIGPGRIEEQLIAEETTQNPMEILSTSSDRGLNMLDSCIELLFPMTAQKESIKKETERAAMLTKRMMETPWPEPPMVELPMAESDQASAKRRRRTRYTWLLGIMENAVYLSPSAWPPTRRV